MQNTDLEKIARQLGRSPRGVIGVAKRCLACHPQVIITYPLFWSDAQLEVFPTLYWLTCPELRRVIGILETEGWIDRLQRRVESDSTLAEQVVRSHGDYARQRVALVRQEELALVQDQYPSQAEVLRKSGIGGARGRGIKCLHTHLAHFLAEAGPPPGDRVNPIGKLIAQLLAEQGTRMDFCYDDEWESFCREGKSGG